MSLEQFQSDEGKAKILSVTIGDIRDDISEEHWKSWSQYDKEGKTPKLDRDHYHVTYDDQGYERTEFLMIPLSKRGYMKSNAKKVIDKNPDLGANPLEWPGKMIKVVYDREGYVSIAI